MSYSTYLLLSLATLALPKCKNAPAAPVLDLTEILKQGGQRLVDLAARFHEEKLSPSAAFQFEQNHSFKGMAEIRASSALIKRDEAGVYRIGFSGIDHALAIGRGVQGDGAHQECVLQMRKVIVQGVLTDG